jgi:aldose 1-epimerase
MSKTNWNGYNLFKLKNAGGVSVTISDLGATIVDFLVPDKSGNKVNIVLGYDTPDKYLNGGSFIGGVVGLWGNRIDNGKYELDGTEYQLEQNEHSNHLHGASCNLHKVQWSLVEHTNELVHLTTEVCEGVAGYPANVCVSVKYELTPESELCITYQAHSDSECPINLTQHSYFNLDGHNGQILDHELLVNADSYWAMDENQIPTVKTLVDGTALDFREQKKVGDNIGHLSLDTTKGYDHCFVLNKSVTGYSGRIHSEKSGITLDFYTDQTGVQVYTGNNLDSSVDGFGKHCGICFETQVFPNQVNMKGQRESDSFVSPSNPYVRETVIEINY